MVINASRICTSMGFDGLCLKPSKPFLKCQISSAIDLNPCIKQEKAEFYTKEVYLLMSPAILHGKGISGFVVNVCYKKAYTTSRYYYIPHGW